MPAKKTAKSKVKPAKKAEPKASKSKAKKKQAAPHEFFFFADGRVAKNVKELAFMLDDISNEVFCSHVNNAKNDFSSWVDGVFDEKELAEVIRQETEVAKLQLKLMKHLVKKHA